MKHAVIAPSLSLLSGTALAQIDYGNDFSASEP